MRKIVMFNLVSVDGYFAGTDGNIDWHVVDPEFDRWAAETINEYDAALFGRKTYELFAGFWPGAVTDPKTKPDDLVVAKALNEWTKIVFSKSLKKADWQHSQIHKDIDPKEIKKLKEKPGKNIVVYGSGSIVQQLTDFGLIDEYRLMVNPIILGNGKSLFKDTQTRKLKLLQTKSFKSGNILLTYQA